MGFDAYSILFPYTERVRKGVGIFEIIDVDLIFLDLIFCFNFSSYHFIEVSKRLPGLLVK